MASKTISDRTTVAGLEDPNEKEDDALQQKVEEFASRYYERILKMKKPKQTTLGPDTVGFVIVNESTGGSELMTWTVRTSHPFCPLTNDIETIILCVLCVL